MNSSHGYNARRGLILIDGREAGLIQILEKAALRGVLHVVMADRGPIWFEGFGGREDFAAFLEAFDSAFPRRWGRRRRIIPEAVYSEETNECLRRHGFRRSGKGGYETAWLDLGQSQEVLRRNLHPKWRGHLSKAERSGLSVEWDDSLRHLPWFLKIYALDKKRRRYPGPEAPFLSVLAQECVQAGEGALIGRALLDGVPVASILILCHGTSATYQAGWTSQEGRDKAAHHLLLWGAVGVLKDRGILDLDLGGMNEKTKGIRRFKMGMGGEVVCLSGLYT
ncbi:MAG: GNAT family N-acetyltransferase [Alphaproteobacteria bacterium]|nr:GNAT family N-acetyltransferase [Alphaproteobacteria bacterium]